MILFISVASLLGGERGGGGGEVGARLLIGCEHMLMIPFMSFT